MSSAALVKTYAELPLEIVSGRGARVTDSAGRELWDLYGGHAVCLLGHSHPAVARAIQQQSERLMFYSNALPLEIRSRAAKRLAAFAPDGLEHVFFCNSGAEANENALKLAIDRTGRQRIAALHGAFHGRTLLALAATDGAKLHRGLESLLCPCTRLRPNCVEDVERIDETVAAVIVEPVMSMAGVIELSGEFLRALRARCDQTGTLLIYDEVQTGLGRLGRPFAAGEHGLLPDMVTLAKGLANGYPVGALLLRPKLAETIGIGDLGTTFGGGPTACAALLAVLDTLEREQLVEAAARFGDTARRKLLGGPVREVLGRGCLLGLRLDRPAKLVHAELLSRGFITGTSGDPNVLRLLPPLSTPLEAIDELADELARIGETAHASLG